MRGVLALLLAAAPCGAVPIFLSNFTTTQEIVMPGAGNFAGWDFSERAGGMSPFDDLTRPEAYLQVGGWSTLQAGQMDQSIRASSSVNYSIPGYAVTSISIYGYAFDGGNVAGENMWLDQPCHAWVAGNSLPSPMTCFPTTSEPLLVAGLNMYADVAKYSGSSNVGPLMLTLRLTPLVHNPEPQLMGLMGFILVGMSRILRRKSRVN